MDASRFYAEVEEAKARAQSFQQEAETHRLLRHTAHPLWRSALAAQLRGVAERLEPQPTPKEIL